MEYVHREIKPDNILIWMDSTGKQVLMKWADFMFLQTSQREKDFTLTKATPGWYAPEILKYIAEDENSYNKSEESPRGTKRKRKLLDY